MIITPTISESQIIKLILFKVRRKLQPVAAFGDCDLSRGLQLPSDVDEHVLRVLTQPRAEPSVADRRSRECVHRHLSVGGRQIQVQVLPNKQGSK